MAREYARVWTSIWGDEDFCALPLRSQWLFIVLVSQPGMTPCGVMPYQPNRWSKLAPELTARQVQQSLSDLEEPRLIVVDRSTDEVLIRSHIRYDKPLRVPNVAIAMARRWQEISSPSIRRQILVELHRLRKEPKFKDMKGWAEPEVADLMEIPYEESL